MNMEYICYKRFCHMTDEGRVSIPRGHIVEAVDGVIADDNIIICKTNSFTAYEYFARNDDGRGLERGDLIDKIRNRLAIENENQQKRYDRLRVDKSVNRLRESKYKRLWIWNFAFYNANIEELQYIWRLINNI